MPHRLADELQVQLVRNALQVRRKGKTQEADRYQRQAQNGSRPVRRRDAGAEMRRGKTVVATRQPGQ